MLFADSLLDVSLDRSRRGWSSFVAYAAEAVLVSAVVFLSVWNTQALPRLSTVYAMIGAPAGEPPRSQPGTTHRPPTHAVPTADPTALVAPSHISPVIDMVPDQPREEPEGPPGLYVPGGIPGAHPSGTGLLPGLLPAMAVRPDPAPPKPAISRVNVSIGVSQGYLLRQVQPVYPAFAKTARLEGAVVLAAIISREGVVENLHAVSGPPMLISAAIDAVRLWRYRPYLLNGQPVEVETQITVNFTLARN